MKRFIVLILAVAAAAGFSGCVSDGYYSGGAGYYNDSPGRCYYPNHSPRHYGGYSRGCDDGYSHVPRHHHNQCEW